MAAHTYWRIYITAYGGGGYNVLREVEMRATLGGADQCSGGTASASSIYSGTYSADKAFDNNTSTYWNSLDATLPAWLKYQFASPVNVAQVAITCHSNIYAPTAFSIDYSDDGTNWTTANSFTGQTGWGASEQRLFTVTANSLAGNISESLGLVDWRISAYNYFTGAFEGTTTSSGATYNVKTSTRVPCLLTITPKIEYRWSAGKVVSSTDRVVAVAPDSTPHLWQCTTPGTTHATTEPTWNLSGTTTDNTVTWTYVAPLVNGAALGPKIPT